MTPLSIQHAIDNKYTSVDCVKYFKPDWSDEECDFHLWEFTCYPFSMKVMIEQLNKYFIKL